MSKLLLCPVFRGQLTYTQDTPENFERFLRSTGRQFDSIGDRRWSSYRDPTDALYCHSEYMQWLVNEQIGDGLILVGSDGDAWVLTKPENT